jgi:hypothetical protein
MLHSSNMQQFLAPLLRSSSVVQSNISLRYKGSLQSSQLLHLPTFWMHHPLFDYLPFPVLQLLIMILLLSWIFQLPNLNLNVLSLSNKSNFSNNFSASKSSFPFVRPTIFILMPSSPVLLRSIPLLCLIFLDFKQRTIILLPSAIVLLRPSQLLCLTSLVFMQRTLETLPRVAAFRSIMMILIAIFRNLSILNILFKILVRTRTRFVLLACVTSTIPKTTANFLATQSTFKGWPGWAASGYLSLRQRPRLLFGLRWGV